jgi:hypothetical protein
LAQKIQIRNTKKNTEYFIELNFRKKRVEELRIKNQIRSTTVLREGVPYRSFIRLKYWGFEDSLKKKLISSKDTGKRK